MAAQAFQRSALESLPQEADHAQLSGSWGTAEKQRASAHLSAPCNVCLLYLLCCHHSHGLIPQYELQQQTLTLPKFPQVMVTLLVTLERCNQGVMFTGRHGRRGSTPGLLEG